MRIKIKGEITADRLAKAFLLALDKYQAVRPGAKVFGSNLYLTAYDADGLPFDLANANGGSLMITIPAPDGGLVKPALTAEADKKLQDAKALIEKQNAEILAMEQEREKQAEIHRQEYSRRKRARDLEYRLVRRVTDTLLKNDPQKFIDELNQVVSSVWEELKPVEVQGKKLGQHKPLPVFTVEDGFLFMETEAWKNPKRLTNPIGMKEYCHFGSETYIWTHPAWLEAVKRIKKLLHDWDSILTNEESQSLN